MGCFDLEVVRCPEFFSVSDNLRYESPVLHVSITGIGQEGEDTAKVGE